MPWTKVLKPAESSVTTISTDVEPFGLLMAITSTLGANTTSITSGWGNISKPTGSGWTNLSKPTVDGFTKVIKPTD